MNEEQVKNLVIGETIEVSGKVLIKDEVRTDGKASKLLALPFGNDRIYSRVISGTKEYDIVNGNIVAGNQITIKGELKKLKSDGESYNYMGIDEISVEDDVAQRTQIVREDAKNRFVEAMMDSFDIGKLRMNFIAYDTTKKSGERQTANIAIYLDVNDADYFCENILNGHYASKIRAEKKLVAEGAQAYPNAADEFFGGTSASVLAKRGQSRSDGKALARVLTVEASNGKDFMLCLTAQQGPGIEGKNGSIQPIRKDFEQKVQIPMTMKAAQRFALAIRRAINAYETSKQVVTKIKEGK